MKTFIISLGGSIIVPDEINVSFLKDFKELILDEADKGNRFVLICGGGGTNRKYNKALQDIAEPSDEDLDWLGINVTKLNAFFVRQIFEDKAHDEIMHNPTKKIETDKMIIIGCGWKPGCSTDHDAVLAAQTFEADTIINLSNIEYAYTKDPKKFDDAEKIERIDWKGFREIVGDVWSPKLDAPFDPIAAKLAQELGLKAIIAKGTDLENLKNILDGKEFKGTIVQD